MWSNFGHLILMVLGVTIFFGSHYFFYFSIVKFFAITNSNAKIYLFGIITFLSLSLIIFSLIAHFINNSFTRYAYIASGVWLGALVNLLLATCFVWFCIWLTRHAAINLHPAGLFSLLIIGVGIISFFGIKNAYNPQVKKVSVTIKNLPANWKGKNIVQISDVHLGHVYQGKFLDDVVEKINAQNPEIVVITGDLFDGMDGQLDALIEPLKNIQAKEGVYFVTGNHETYLGIDNALKVLKKTNIQVLNNEVVDVAGLKLIGVSYPDIFESNDDIAVLQSLQNKFVNLPNILLFHLPVNIPEARALGVNLQLSGHTHLGQQFPFSLITHLVYHGYDYGLHTLGDFSIYTTSGLGTWGIPMRIGTTSEIVAIELN